MSLAFKRMYVDIPTETHDKLVTLAHERGMSQKGLVAELIENATTKKPATKKRRSKKRG